MHTFRPLLILTLLITLASGCARRNKAAAKAKSTPVAAPAVAPTAARDLTDVMTEQLKLRPDQQPRVRAILTSTTEQVNAAQQQHAANRPALLAELKRINLASDKQLQQVLTATQYQQLKARQRQMQAEMQARKAGQ
ncbi:hypothetical protein [Hymenobacter weizhouensis]|uniref:hypothetical protein n=1 Tax=Hymenobacter sp. YIM 151500-1 TaxID=2987689 RepID=UPI00222784B9|nr:hypothetical protein [Hymenobacter sp. YIM 151500-1]UYZ62641.1 hypothetical protein OIS53_16765 [Hymenobacter sp. YIM 151500-1]